MKSYKAINWLLMLKNKWEIFCTPIIYSISRFNRAWNNFRSMYNPICRISNLTITWKIDCPQTGHKNDTNECDNDERWIYFFVHFSYVYKCKREEHPYSSRQILNSLTVVQLKGLYDINTIKVILRISAMLTEFKHN